MGVGWGGDLGSSGCGGELLLEGEQLLHGSVNCFLAYPRAAAAAHDCHHGCHNRHHFLARMDAPSRDGAHPRIDA